MSKSGTNRLVSPKKVAQAGIAGLASANTVLKARADAERLFDLVMQEQGSTADLRRLVTHDSILELIFHCVDLTKVARARVNAQRSHEKSVNAREKALSALHGWLDKNISRYKGRLEKCTIDCHAALNHKTGGLGRSEQWVRKEITAYRKAKDPP